jgi:hypothetical protein
MKEPGLKPADVEKFSSTLDALAERIRANRQALEAGDISERTYSQRREELVQLFIKTQAAYVEVCGIRYEPKAVKASIPAPSPL